MKESFSIIQNLLQERADYQARLNLLPYDGSPEIKENGSGKYIYIRKRVAGKLTSTYVDLYTEELYQEYVSKLETAGVYDYIEAVQAQIDAWVAAQ